MKKTPLRSSFSDDGLPLGEVELFADEWLLDGEVRSLSKNTSENRRFLMEKFVWYLRGEEFASCWTHEIRSFFAYVNKAHERPEGRWDNPRLKAPLSSRTVHTYFVNLRTFFEFVKDQGRIQSNPFDDLRQPVHRGDQIQPFSEEHLERLFAVAKKSKHPKRDTAILWFLFDTGARASELCSIKYRQLDLDTQSVVVTGKGNKKRKLFFGKTTRKALWEYLRSEPHEDDDALFLADRGVNTGDHLTRWGLLQLVERLGRTAGLDQVRCSPHTFRHTFAVNYIRSGGDAFSLKEILGHSSLTVTNRYVAIAEADVESKHRQFSPADQFKRKRRNGS